MSARLPRRVKGACREEGECRLSLFVGTGRRRLLAGAFRFFRAHLMGFLMAHRRIGQIDKSEKNAVQVGTNCFACAKGIDDEGYEVVWVGLGVGRSGIWMGMRERGIRCC